MISGRTFWRKWPGFRKICMEFLLYKRMCNFNQFVNILDFFKRKIDQLASLGIDIYAFEY